MNNTRKLENTILEATRYNAKVKKAMLELGFDYEVQMIESKYTSQKRGLEFVQGVILDGRELDKMMNEKQGINKYF